MTREDILRMAKEADLWMTSEERIAAVERFFKAAYAAGAAAEREAVLDLVDAYAKNNTDLRDAIRARRNT